MEKYTCLFYLGFGFKLTFSFIVKCISTKIHQVFYSQFDNDDGIDLSLQIDYNDYFK